MGSIRIFCDSGLAHQAQRNGHPFKNIVVRIPGPSWMENFWILKVVAFMFFPFLLLYVEPYRLFLFVRMTLV